MLLLHPLDNWASHANDLSPFQAELSPKILENNRWFIGDFVAMYENDELLRLCDGYPECKDGQWVGEPPY